MKSQKTAVHFTDRELLQVTNPVKVILIGAGGTGSQVMTSLAQMSHALCALGHPGLHITLWDDDTVTEANLGRQLFAQCELGLPKAVTLVNRCNRFFGTDWKARTQRFGGIQGTQETGEIYISCVDNVASRFEIATILKEMDIPDYNHHKPKYIMDFGNGQTSGQVVLGTVGKVEQPQSQKFKTVGYLPPVTEEFATLMKQSEEKDDTPSCSLAEALTKQDLFINAALSKLGMSLLWNLFRKGMIKHRGFFLNLEDFRTQPIPVG